MLRAIGVIIAAVATFAVLVSTQRESTLAVACSTFLEPCKVTDSQNSRKTVEAKPSESITTDGLSPQGESTLAEVVAGSKE
jgi:hypothetical protein